MNLSVRSSTGIVSTLHLPERLATPRSLALLVIVLRQLGLEVIR